MYWGPPYNRRSRSPHGHGHVLFLVFKHIIGVFMLTNIAIGYIPQSPHHVDAHDSHTLVHVEYGWHDTVWRSESDQSEHHEHDPHTEEEEINVSSAFIYVSIRLAARGALDMMVQSTQFFDFNGAL